MGRLASLPLRVGVALTWTSPVLSVRTRAARAVHSTQEPDDRLYLLLSPPPPYCGVRPAFSARGAQPAVTVLHCDRQGLARFSLLSSDAFHVVTFYPGLSFLWLHSPPPYLNFDPPTSPVSIRISATYPLFDASSASLQRPDRLWMIHHPVPFQESITELDTWRI